MTVPARNRIVVNWVILAAASVALAGALFVYYRAVTAPPDKKRGQGRGFRFTVRTAPVQRATLTPSIPLQGDVVSNETATIRAEISGVVTKVLVANGQQVKAGTVLVELDNRDRVLALRRQQALSMEAHAAQVGSRTTVAKAQDLVTRLKKLDKYKLVSAESVEQARIGLLSARAGAAQANAQTALRYVELLTARQELERAKIRALFAGRIAKRLVAAGDRVAVGAQVVELVGGAGLELHLYVPVSATNRVHAGTTVRYRLAGRAGPWQQGAITRVLPMVDPLSRNRTVVVSLPKPPGGFTPGQAVEARLSVGRLAGALVVDTDALTRTGDTWVVFTVKAGKARRVEVKILGEDGRRIAVSGNLTAGQPVVVVGNEALFPNAAVRVVTPRKAAPQASSGSGSGSGSDRPAAATR